MSRDDSHLGQIAGDDLDDIGALPSGQIDIDDRVGWPARCKAGRKIGSILSQERRQRLFGLIRENPAARTIGQTIW